MPASPETHTCGKGQLSEYKFHHRNGQKKERFISCYVCMILVSTWNTRSHRNVTRFQSKHSFSEDSTSQRYCKIWLTNFRIPLHYGIFVIKTRTSYNGTHYHTVVLQYHTSQFGLHLKSSNSLYSPLSFPMILKQEQLYYVG